MGLIDFAATQPSPPTLFLTHSRAQVNTPTKQYGLGKGAAADVMYIEQCARSIAKFAESPKIVIEKSTVPAKTAQTLDTILSNNSREGITFQVLLLSSFWDVLHTYASCFAVRGLTNTHRHA
jgi:UDP-N-acetyl-D-mannosaminuronate dehydrogenase